MTWNPHPWELAMEVASACVGRAATDEAATRDWRRAIVADEMEHCPSSAQGLTDDEHAAFVQWVDGLLPTDCLVPWVEMLVRERLRLSQLA